MKTTILLALALVSALALGASANMLTGVAWINFRAGDGLDSIVYGIVTGLGLVWLVHSGPPNVNVKGSVDETVIPS